MVHYIIVDGNSVIRTLDKFNIDTTINSTGNKEKIADKDDSVYCHCHCKVTPLHNTILMILYCEASQHQGS